MFEEIKNKQWENIKEVKIRTNMDSDIYSAYVVVDNWIEYLILTLLTSWFVLREDKFLVEKDEIWIKTSYRFEDRLSLWISSNYKLLVIDIKYFK